MISQRIWTIGTAWDCDIRVESPTVSARHCRLTRRGQSFFVEDLSSTNGTFVAGETVRQPRAVRPGEPVMLGQSTPMPWPDLSAIAIGRLPDNDFVVPLDNVSGHHARLERRGHSVYIVDLGSRNGTAINDPQNRISHAEVRPGDAVFLGTHRLDANDLLACLPEVAEDRSPAAQRTQFEGPTLAAVAASANSTDRGTNPDLRLPSGSRRGPAASFPAWIVPAGIGAVFAIVVAVAARGLLHPDRRQAANESGAATNPEASATSPMDSSGPPTVRDVKPARSPAPPDHPRQRPVFDEERIRESQKGVYLVCIHTNGKVFFTKVTAWAVSPEAIVCPLGMIKKIEQFRKKDQGSDDCGVVCSPSKALRIVDYAPCDGDGASLAIGRLDSPAAGVAADRKDASTFKPEEGQKLAVIVARGSSVDKLADDKKNIATTVIPLTVKRVQRDSQSPDGLICAPAEDVGLADGAPVFDGAGVVVGCVATPERGDAEDEVRVVLLRRIPKLMQAIPRSHEVLP